MLAEIITRGIDFETIKKMHIAGFFHVQIGYESPSDTLLYKIDKKNSFASNLFFIKWAHELNINVGGMNVLRGLLEENLEDIKAPECFYIEQKLRERMNIPVFHDDQHGTAIISAAAIINSLRIVGKKIEDVRLVASGAGAASIACLNLLLSLGMKRENITVCDSKGVVYKGRDDKMDQTKKDYAIEDNGWRTLADAVNGADVFLGCSKAGALKPEMVKTMAENPLILALANPTPEITPDEAKAVRPDAIVCTGRSDFPNQVNNVLCFPFLFRGALDVGATAINEEMKLAASHAIASLAKEPVPLEIIANYGALSFGPDYVIPTPFDPRLLFTVSSAVAKKAMETGVATRPITDWAAYEKQLKALVAA